MSKTKIAFCDMRLGQEFISFGGEKPENMCDSAWESMEYFVKELSNGGGISMMAG